MKCINGVWYHQGRSYATLYEALAAVWPRVLSSMIGHKETAPGTANTVRGRAKTRWIKSTPIIAGGERKIKMEFSEQDKIIIANAMYSIIFDLEGAEAVLWAAHGIYFHDDQKDIPASAAVTLGRLLGVYLGLMNGVLKQYEEIVGDK